MKKCILLISIIVKYYNMQFDNNSENRIKFHGTFMKEKVILHFKVITIPTRKDKTINWGPRDIITF